MKIIELEQNSESWNKWRLLGIGASDISVLMETNIFLSPYDLWELKCGFKEDKPINPAIKHGIMNEDKARQWVNNNLNLNLKPLCVEEEGKPEFRASLDGYDKETGIMVEIKCPVNPNTIANARFTQSVPQYWIDQILWQMMIVNPTKALIAVWDYNNNCCHTIEVYQDKKRILEMRQVAETFWAGVKMGKPPALKNTDYIEIEDDSLYELLIEYKDIAHKEKFYTDFKRALKEKITEYGDDSSFTCRGFKITRNNPKKTYDYEKMAFDGIDIEKYSKINKELISYTIRCPQ
jgi:putative phage-type endonuclease